MNVQTWRVAIIVSLVFLSGRFAVAEEGKPYRLPSVSVKEPILWSAQCELPDGTGVAFGGLDQDAEDGAARTRVKENGKWRSITDGLCKSNRLQGQLDAFRSLLVDQNQSLAQQRSTYFSGRLSVNESDSIPELHQVQILFDRVCRTIDDLPEADPKAAEGLANSALSDAKRAGQLFRTLAPGHQSIEILSRANIALDKAMSRLDAEPSPRALSPIVYDTKHKVFVLFAGDHLDYLTNDLWTFDPAASKWTRHHPKAAPAPRANHKLVAKGDGTITLTGGYTYANNTDYMGGQYADIGDGPFIYDLSTDTWTGKDNLVASDSRTYRTGPFDPKFFLEAPPPDAAAFAKKLESLPANEWVMTDPPKLPKMQRDWGSAILDPDHNLILRWSGGHCAHGGTDVLHYHIATNRWELTAPVEFPLGQLYDNTEYPHGVSFNRRAWITGHTYQNYGYDPNLKQMIYAGQTKLAFPYDPTIGDWLPGFAKPAGMDYESCFYSLTTCTTPKGLIAWTNEGDLFRFDTARKNFVPLELTGDKLEGSVVDNSTIVYDAKRDRLCAFQKLYGDDHSYDGKIQVVDLKTLNVTTLIPSGAKSAGTIPYLCQIRYDAANDLLLVGATLPPDENHLRRTPAYDPTSNAWVSLTLTGSDPSGEKGRNVSLGMMYDAKRNLFWAVDTDCHVYVIRLDPKTASTRQMNEDAVRK